MLRITSAQTTRTGRMRNLALAVVFADGEITSNLRLTQAAYDLLNEHDQISALPLQEEHVTQAISDALPELLKDDGVAYALVQGDGLQNLLGELRTLTEDETRLKGLLKTINGEANNYAVKYIKPEKKAE